MEERERQRESKKKNTATLKRDICTHLYIQNPYVSHFSSFSISAYILLVCLGSAPQLSSAPLEYFHRLFIVANHG